MQPKPDKDSNKLGTDSNTGLVPMLAGFWGKASGVFTPRSLSDGGYIRFYRTYFGVLSFAALFTLFSSLGQTFLLSFFQPYWMEAFDLSAGAIGRFYGIATLASGLLLPWVGRKLDTVPIERFSLVSGLALGGFALLTAMVWSPWVLLICFFGLRFFGQGVAPNVAMTLTGRSFDKDRGKAVSIAGLGFPLGEAFFPALLTVMIVAIGWRMSWVVLAAMVFLLLVPLSHYLLRMGTPRSQLEESGSGDGKTAGSGSGKPLPRSFFLSDWRFYGIVVALLPLPFFTTGIIFFQTILVESRGWTPAAFAFGFAVFAFVRASFSLVAGHWIDRWSALSLVSLQLLLYIFALAGLTLDTVVGAYLFFIGIGLSFGLGGSVMSAVWAEIYGTTSLGTIRGITGSFGVFSTALAPAFFGMSLDMGLSLQQLIVLSFVSSVLVFLPLSLITVRSLKQRPPQLPS
ncbi:MAG: MFS transporter [Opitutales bacterium]|nr:MFS transporter [Opitutales bacterium]